MVKVICASVLVLILACSTRAGEMQNGSPEPPPPVPPVVVLEEKKTAEEGDEYGDLMKTLTEAALSVLDNVLALL